MVVASPELQERELIKLATLAAALAAGLRRRGVPEPHASLAAEAGIVVLRVGFERWVGDTAEDDLRREMRTALAHLRTITAP